MDSLDSYRAGYPRYSALIASDDAFQIFRRFTYLRTRLLLKKQDRLSLLEAQLNAIDRDETSPLALGCARKDTNKERSAILDKIDEALTDYDDCLTRGQTALSFEPSRSRDVASLQNWTEGNACTARDETNYLDAKRDLANIAARKDNALERVESLCEMGMAHLASLCHMVRKPKTPSDSNVYNYSGPLLKLAGRVMTALLVDVLLFVPVVLLHELSSFGHQILVIVVACGVFITVLSGFTKARTNEVFLAGASYAAILVVFLAGNGSNSE